MATMVDVGLIEVNSRTLKRIEDNDEAAKRVRGVDCERLKLCATVLYPVGMGCVPYHTVRGHAIEILTASVKRLFEVGQRV